MDRGMFGTLFESGYRAESVTEIRWDLHVVLIGDPTVGIISDAECALRIHFRLASSGREVGTVCRIWNVAMRSQRMRFADLVSLGVSLPDMAIVKSLDNKKIFYFSYFSYFSTVGLFTTVHSPRTDLHL
jgi:hypothetical protein